MQEAREHAKRARRLRDHGTAGFQNQYALQYETKMKNLNSAAAKLIFEEKNKARGHLVMVLRSCVLNHPCARITPPERLTSTTCSLKKLSSTQRRNFNRPPDGQTMWCTSLLVRPLSASLTHAALSSLYCVFLRHRQGFARERW